MQDTIKDLICLGEYLSSEDVPPSTLLENLKSPSRKFTGFLSPRDNENQERVKRLDEKSLRHLIMGQTIAERDLGHSWGSISRIPMLFEWYCEPSIYKVSNFDFRSLSGKYKDLADWILQNTNNPYVPFGYYQNGGSKSYEEFINHQDRVSETLEISRNISIEKEKEQQEIKENKKAKAELHNSRSVQENIRRKTEMANFESKTLEQKLEIILSINSKPLEYYPESIANTISKNINDIQNETLITLRKLIDRRKKGSWAKLAKLIDTLDPKNMK